MTKSKSLLPPHPVVHTRRRKLLALTSLGLAGLLAGLLAGCSSSATAIPAAVSATSASFAAMTGNWQFTSGAAVQFAGALAVSGDTISGKLHAINMTCAADTPFSVEGTVSSDRSVSMASTGFAGGVLSITGALSPDQHSLLSPTVTLAGGSCAALASHSLRADNNTTATGQQYQPITGSYDGSFTDTSGVSQSVNTTLSQPTTPDGNGVYHLTGTATFASNPCLTNPLVTDSTVSGNQISATYTDPNTQAQITGTGTFSSDASTISITNWVLSGSCDQDSGTGALTRH